MEELHMVVEDLRLHRLSAKQRREPILVGVNCHKPGLAHGKRGITEHGVWVLGKLQQMFLILLPELLNGDIVPVV